MQLLFVGDVMLGRLVNQLLKARPPAEHPPFARALLDAGADIIFGHSGHVWRGIEWYQCKPILYCAGDFIDDYAMDELERNDQGFVCVVELEGDRVRRLLLYPTVIGEFQARRACPDEAEAIAGKMGGLCAELHTNASWQEEEQALLIEP